VRCIEDVEIEGNADEEIFVISVNDDVDVTIIDDAIGSTSVDTTIDGNPGGVERFLVKVVVVVLPDVVEERIGEDDDEDDGIDEHGYKSGDKSFTPLVCAPFPLHNVQLIDSGTSPPRDFTAILRATPSDDNLRLLLNVPIGTRSHRLSAVNNGSKLSSPSIVDVSSN